jgi:hypothetical protein
MEEDTRRESAEGDRQARAPYRAPVLTVLGPVAVLTNTLNMAGTTKDGGANNTKS